MSQAVQSDESMPATSVANGSTRVLVFSATFPSGADPFRGVFVKERAKALSRVPGFEVQVVAPVPWFPPLKRFPKWYRLSQYAREEVMDELQVFRPRYPLLPKVGGYIHPQLMFPTICRFVDRLRKDYPFDLIDSHFVYPSGAVAARLGERYQVPVVTTGRGEDMSRFPHMPLIGKEIRKTLRRGQLSIGVSREIAEAMKSCGADPEKTHVVANGIDTEKFRRLPQAECREHLNLPPDKRILISVGDRLELKGFHLLVDAMPEILRKHPNAMLVIVGGSGRFGRDYTSEIESRIEQHQLHEQVLLTGARPHEELMNWYNAADLFLLMSSREGSPNVLIEALASGTPAIGTPVGGIPDELANPVMGRVLRERSAQAAAETIAEALDQSWDRDAICNAMKSRSWQTTADRLASLLQGTVQEYAGSHGRADKK